MRRAEHDHSEHFPTTRWSLVDRVGDHRESRGRAALSELLTRYLPALRAHLVVTKRIRADQAEDLLQSFVSAKFLETNLATGANRDRGKFRTLLLTCLDRFVVSEVRKSNALKRGGRQAPALDVTDMEVSEGDPRPPSCAFELAWARELLAEVTRRMQTECEKSGRPELWGVFDARVLRPILNDVPPAHYDELVRRFGFQSPTHASNILVTAKRMYQRLLRAAVAEYAGREEEIDAEIHDLHAILSRGAPQ